MAKVPRARRRYLTFSLRTFFVLLTAFAIWLGVVVNRAREQREAVKAIEALDGITIPEARSGLAWLARIVGDDYFQQVRRVDFGFDPCRKAATRSSIQEAIPYLTRLRELEAVDVFVVAEYPIPIEVEHELKAALPNCEIRFLR